MVGAISIEFHSFSKTNFHRFCTALCLAVIYRFDIIAVRIEDKGGVIAEVIDPLAGAPLSWPPWARAA